MNSDAILARIRKFLLVISASVFAMTITELILLGHWNETIQILPFVLSVFGVATLTLVYFRPNRINITWMRYSMVVIGACSFIGFFIHLSSNYRFWTKVRPDSATWELIRGTLEGGNPILAPGILLFGAIVGLTAIYKQTELTQLQNSQSGELH